MCESRGRGVEAVLIHIYVNRKRASKKQNIEKKESKKNNNNIFIIRFKTFIFLQFSKKKNFLSS